MHTWQDLRDAQGRRYLADICRASRSQGASVEQTREAMIIAAARLGRALGDGAGIDQTRRTDAMQDAIARNLVAPTVTEEPDRTDCRDLDRAVFRTPDIKMIRGCRKQSHHVVKAAHRLPYGHGRTW